MFKILSLALLSLVSFAQITVIPNSGGSGATASGYYGSATAASTLTVTAATHGQGTTPVAACFDNSVPAVSVACSYTRNTSGDIVFTWSPAFTGTVNIWSAAGTSGISGGTNLTTVGAIPYVSSSGVLNQDATKLFWDSANSRIGVGTTSPANIIDAQSGGTAIISTRSTSAATNALFESRGGSSRWYAGIIASHDAKYSIVDVNTSVYALQVHGTTDNITIGGTTDGNYKLDVQKSGITGTLRVYDQTATTGSTLAVIQAGAGQSGNLQEWRDNSGNKYAAIQSDGSISAKGSASFILYKDSNFNTYWSYLNSSGLNAASSFLLGFSSTTDASGTKDAGLARAAAGYIKVTDGSTGLGKIVVSQSTPAASTDACTAGALWADATYIYACTASGTIKRATLATF